MILSFFKIDEPDCDCGFMSIDRIALLLSVQKVSIGGRQQITPSMKITCHGMLTKWIIGADWKSSKEKFPQLQIWSETGEKTYKMVNHTQVQTGRQSYANIYEFELSPPITVEPGYVVGILIPPESDSKLSLKAERSLQPINYYVSTTHTNYSCSNLEKNILSDAYSPLVTVEIDLFSLNLSSILTAVPKPSYVKKVS